MAPFPVRTAMGAVVVLVLVQTYCSFMTPWIALLFLAWVLGGASSREQAMPFSCLSKAGNTQGSHD